jgi:O-succinylbenzoic acid--CoA ligase
MSGRPLHAAVLAPGAALRDLLGEALEGSGPAVVPVDPGLPARRMRRLLDALAPAVVVGPDGAVARPGGRPVPDDVAAVLVTSGSTGRAKAAELPAAALLSSARATLARIGGRPGERWLCSLPSWHVAGLQVLTRSLLLGTDPVVLAPSDTAGIAATAAAGGCAHAALVPTQLRRLLEHGADLSRLRTILLGGAAPPAGLLTAARAAGARVVTTYGMTETCGGCVYDGWPLAEVDVRAGQDGRIRIAGPILMRGYRLRPELTAAAFDGRWFVTSDLGAVAAGGRLVVRGRADDVITTGGEKVLPADVTAEVEAHPAVRAAVVFGLADAEWGERVTVVVVPTDPVSPPTLAEIRAHVARRLPAFAAPRQLLIADQIPLLGSGKADIAALRALTREQSGTNGV